MTQEKLESGEEAEQRLTPEVVEETNATQIGAGPAKRKREADENDVAEETEKSEVGEKDYSGDEGGTEASFPKVTIIPKRNCRLEAMTAKYKPSLRHSRGLRPLRGRNGRSRVENRATPRYLLPPP